MVTADALDSLDPDALDSPDDSLVPLEALVLSPTLEELPVLSFDSRVVLPAEAPRFWAFATSAGSCPEAS